MARILLIDDEVSLRELLALTLIEGGHTVIQAANGKEGVARFYAEPADLLITDLVMPDQEGIETMRTLRVDFPRLPVIAISGSVNSSLYLDLALRLGAQRALAKPFVGKELLDTVSEVLAQAQGDSAASD